MIPATTLEEDALVTRNQTQPIVIRLKSPAKKLRSQAVFLHIPCTVIPESFHVKQILFRWLLTGIDEVAGGSSQSVDWIDDLLMRYNALPAYHRHVIHNPAIHLHLMKYEPQNGV